MKNYARIISPALAVLIIAGSCSACVPAAPSGTRESVISVADEDTNMDLGQEMIPLAQSPAVPVVLTPVASGAQVKRNAKSVIDYSNTADGYVMVKWTAETKKQLRVLITGSGGATYTYTILPDNTFEVFPLSDGNGSYTVNVYEQTDGSKYALANTLNVKVTLKDEFAPFLRPNQYVNFSGDSRVAEKAAELVTGKDSLTDKIAAVYNFVVSNFSYDKELADSVQSGYLPDVDAVLSRRKGICFDYAAVMAAMLRSQGIPVKLVVGFAGDAYHAWISVYSEQTGWINKAIFFDGKSWKLMDPTFESSMKNAAALQNFIGDGSNYLEKYLY